MVARWFSRRAISQPAGASCLPMPVCSCNSWTSSLKSMPSGFSADGDDPYSVVAQADDLRLYAKGELDDFELMLRMEVAYEEHECDC